MPPALFTDALRQACPQFAAIKARTSPLNSNREADRIALTHALHCNTCKPIADRIREQWAQQEGLR